MADMKGALSDYHDQYYFICGPLFMSDNPVHHSQICLDALRGRKKNIVYFVVDRHISDRARLHVGNIFRHE